MVGARRTNSALGAYGGAAKRSRHHRRTRSLPALLWCIDWPEGQQLDPRDLDPWFIEVCRRVRLTNADGALSARGSTSRSTRIDAKAYKGNVGDPWAPVHKTEGKSFTLSGRDFDYTQLCELMFSGDWAVPPLARFGK